MAGPHERAVNGDIEISPYRLANVCGEQAGGLEPPFAGFDCESVVD